jgi:hypothetical protein
MSKDHCIPNSAAKDLDFRGAGLQVDAIKLNLNVFDLETSLLILKWNLVNKILFLIISKTQNVKIALYELHI